MAYLLIAVSLGMAALVFAMPSNRWRPLLLPIAGIGHLALVLHAVFGMTEPVRGHEQWLLLDPLGKVVLLVQSVLFCVCSLYAPGYLVLRADRANRVFCANLLAMQAMMTLVSLSHHLGLMWVGMEATTLVSAPLLYFNHNPRSLEATWKYLLIGSVGIALALLGTFFLAYAAVAGLDTSVQPTLHFDQLVAHAPGLSAPWLHAAFVLLVVGYGTKMGLAPMHTWKPDAYGEAPGIVGTLLAGGVTSCAFLAILRIYQICRAHSEAEAAFAREIMVFLGLFSMAFAAVFMVRQRDFKRMLAYSSVEHMGILVIGIGVGTSLAIYGALLHLFTNAFTKGVLFLSAGNIHRAYGSKLTDNVTGALQRVPLSGGLFLAGFLAITGAPPFGPFRSELTIIAATFQAGRYVTAGLFLLMMGIVFIGMGDTVLRIVQGNAPENNPSPIRDSATTCVPILVFMGLVLLLGLYIPPRLEELLNAATRFLEGQP